MFPILMMIIDSEYQTCINALLSELIPFMKHYFPGTEFSALLIMCHDSLIKILEAIFLFH